MHRSIALIALFFAAEASAQWGGFLDPEIIRRAGEGAATGNIELGNMEMDNPRIGHSPPQAHAPSAAEIAAEMRRQQQQERYEAESRRRQAVEARVRAGLAAAYQSDMGR